MKKAQTKFMLLLLCLLITACALGTPQSGDVIQREGEPDVYIVESDDQEMNEAIQTAQETLNEFITDLQSPAANQTYFSIKARFPVSEKDGDYEHIWLYDIACANQVFTGRIGNEPIDATYLQLDEKVTVAAEDVSDWMIIEKGILKGGYTLQVLRNQMSPEEREQFDHSIDFKITDE